MGAPGIGLTQARVYVFRFNGSAWMEEWYGFGVVSSDQLGYSVATNAAGDIVAAGAPRRPSANYWSSNVGGVDVYRHLAGGWVHEATVLPSEAGGSDYVGNVIALSADGNVLAMRSGAHGSPITNGAVYLFEHVGSTWTQVAKLQEPVAYSTGGFGNAIALDATGRTVALGNYADSRIAYYQGAVSIFRKGNSGWGFECALLPSNPAAQCYFGGSVAVNAAGDRVFSGALGYEFSSGFVAGGVQEFEHTILGWQSGPVYFSPTPQSASDFGRTVRSSATGRRWVVSEHLSDQYGIDAGQVHVFESPCTSPVIYCTAKTNSLGCVPQIAAQGTPSASSSSGFTISLSNTRNRQFGLLFYGTNGRCSLPWNGGTLCVQPPLARTPVQNSGGSAAPTTDCSGAFAFDFNRWTAAGRDPALFAGQHVRAQYYSRDPGASFQLNVSDAIEFRLEP
ncbi:MAG: hypothetical protein Q8K63_14710 [Acidimicrobiales bacterium]|nr:hypothetical protein [Acidimicrobiales bacterium]